MSDLSLLPATEKAQALDALNAHPLANVTLEQNLRLALHDSAEWAAWIKSRLRPGLPGEFTPVIRPSHGLGVIVQRMAEPLKEELMRTVGRLYPRLQTSSDGFDSPKRDLDYFLHAAFDGEGLITDELSKGRSGLQAYDAYRRAVKKTVFPEVPVGLREASDVSAMLSVLQRHLKSITDDDLIPPEDRFFLVGGSLAAGRERSSSDIDISTPLFLSDATLKALTAEARRYFREKGVNTKLHFEPFGDGSVEPREHSYPGEFASSSPVVFHVTPSAAEMWVFKPAFALHQDEATREPPRVVPLRLAS